LPDSIEKPPPPKATICRVAFSIVKWSSGEGESRLYRRLKFFP